MGFEGYTDEELKLAVRSGELAISITNKRESTRSKNDGMLGALVMLAAASELTRRKLNDT